MTGCAPAAFGIKPNSCYYSAAIIAGVVGFLPKCAVFIDNTYSNKIPVDEEEPVNRQGNAGTNQRIGTGGFFTTEDKAPEISLAPQNLVTNQGKEQLNADQGGEQGEIIGGRGVATEMHMHAVTLTHHGDANYGHDRAGMTTLSVNVLKVLRFLQTRDWETCRLLRLAPASHAEIEGTMNRYITYHLERQVRSMAFIHRLRSQMGVGQIAD